MLGLKLFHVSKGAPGLNELIVTDCLYGYRALLLSKDTDPIGFVLVSPSWEWSTAAPRRLYITIICQNRPPMDPATVKPVCNDHLYNKIYHL